MAASPSTARAINDRLALELLQEEGPLTAAQLKTLTGLSRPTVADLVERLQGSGLVRIVGESGGRRRGPNARLYGLVADRAHLAALDVRTQGVSVVVSDLLGATLAEAVLPIGSDTGVEPAVEGAAALLERTVRRAGAVRLHSVGIGAPGLIDPATGELRETSGVPVWHRRLVAALQQRLTATVLVENETNLAAVAEQRVGAARDQVAGTFVLLWLGLGVGAALVLDGKVRRGASGGAGEIGFLPVPGTSGLPSATACDGGFHTLAGSAGICELASRHGLFAEARPQEPRAAAVVRAAWAAGAAGDAFLDELAARLAVGAAAISAVLDPGRVVLGGEVGQAGGPALASRVEARLAEMSPLRTEVVASPLGGAAVLRGALFTARDAAQNDLFAPTV
ncbi:ROK family transcriptional regulator [Streptomyces sp. NBC_01498]|uniref:ROK family transcriptional regulator n=1 Tax=Streptomyces sp. NBC_01498 TaxID=2975870 RepID=UPI002E7AC043|nr:ROK family transcriptional regulator [Streptomyces sp. NBC_01498]WTL27890.1 ROK family transcriptional regulator [Streptomyces sp. NBC_01498]